MTGLIGLAGPLLWPWIAAAAGLGLVLGGVTCSAVRPGRGGRVALWLAVLAVAALAAASAFAWVPGRAGLWLDIGLVLALAYGLGCGLGCAARRVVRA